MEIRRIPAWVAQTNAYVVSVDSKAFIVDAPPEPEPIGSYLAGLDVVVTGILLTHGHVDHTGGSGWLSRNTGAVTYVHPDDDFLTLHPERQLQLIFGMAPPGEYAVPERFTDLQDGEKLTLGAATLEVKHTPGHTPGHCCFYWADEGVLFSGDQLFAGSIGRTDLPGGSFEDLMRSMTTQILTLADDVDVLPGHGPETTIGRERHTNPFLTSRR